MQATKVGSLCVCDGCVCLYGISSETLYKEIKHVEAGLFQLKSFSHVIPIYPPSSSILRELDRGSRTQLAIV